MIDTVGDINLDLKMIQIVVVKLLNISVQHETTNFTCNGELKRKQN